MRLSCNGCRVLRNGCSEKCSIRPCLQWIKSPQSQANATVFLAKFYGRAGLLNLINAGSEQLRPSIFMSLLYEACGRIVNPIYGPVGLLWSGSWELCQEAVESVLKGAPIVPLPTEDATNPGPLKGYGLGDVAKAKNSGSAELHKFKNLNLFKRSGKLNKLAELAVKIVEQDESDEVSNLRPGSCLPDGLCRASSRSESQNEAESTNSEFFNDTVEVSLLSQVEPDRERKSESPDKESGEVKLELRLSFEPVLPKSDQHDEPLQQGKPHAELEAPLGLELSA